MAESRNTFIKSKMNKDLDSRLVPNGDYRNAENVSISRSEGADVGALENTLGTLKVSDFGLGSDCKTEIIGKFIDTVNNRIFVFLTDYTDNSSDKLSNPAYLVSGNSTGLGSAGCYIGVFNANTGNSEIIVSGAFLNFSKTHIITGVNLLEDLLFWTDNRNQPRKINVTTAIALPSYYYTEDHVSVAKIYPFEVISFLNKPGNPASGGNDYTSLMKDVVSPSLPGWPKVTSTSIVNAGLDYKVGTLTNIPTTGGTGSGLTVDGVTNSSGTFTSITINNPGQGYTNGDTITINGEFVNDGVPTKIAIIEGKNGAGYTPDVTNNPSYEFVSGPGAGTKVAWLQRDGFIYGTSVENGRSLVTIDTNTTGSGKKVGDILKVPIPTGSLGMVEAELEVLNIDFSATPCTFTLTVQNSPNPDLDSNYKGDEEYMKDKFIRFSYRFKFDDGEYSLIAPFTQIAFVPEQDGFFISSDEEVAYKSTDLNLMRNKINQIKMNIPSPLPIFSDQSEGVIGKNAKWSKVFDYFKITDVDILYKESQSSVIKVLETIPQDVFSQNTTSYISYTYEGNKPYRVLPSKEIVRVSDITPLRAASQEVISNRLVYGGYLDKGTEPLSIAYNASIENKSSQVLGGSDLQYINTDYRKEYQNHTLKQNRTYQLGLVLSDRYGRQSNVILSTYDSKEIVGKSGSTIYNPYKNENFITNGDMKEWPGDSLAIEFDELIPNSINNLNYPGLFFAGNSYARATGWYSVKFVVKQSQQEYYNAYLPGLLRGVPNPNTNEFNLQNPYLYSVVQSDNINKIPRNLLAVGPEQQIFSTSKPNSLEGDLAYVKNNIINSGLEGFDIDSLDENSLQDEKIKNILKQRDRLETRLKLGNKENSSVDMYLRVNNILGTTSAQYFPNIDNSSVLSSPDNVVLIGKGTDLGLYDIEPSQSNLNSQITRPNKAQVNFLEAESSPLIMKIQSSDINNGPGTTSANMVPMLAVYETTPVDSSLDIYWETSLAIPINILNNTVIPQMLTGSQPHAMAMNTGLNFDIPYMVKTEGSQIAGDVFTDFQVVTSNGAPLGADVDTVTLDAVFDELGNNEISSWTLVGNNPTLNLQTNKFLYSAPNNRFRNFHFTVTTTSGVIKNLFFNASIKNVGATINFPTAGSNFTSNLQGGLVVSPTGVNGAAGPLDKTKDLNWRISSQTNSSGNPVNYFNIGTGSTAGSCNLNSIVLTSTQASTGPFNISIELNDRPFQTVGFPAQSAVTFTITVS